MQLGMIGLGRMGANMVQRLITAGHELHVYSSRPAQIKAMEAKGAKGSTSLETFVGGLKAPRAIWLMVPAAAVDRRARDADAAAGAGRHRHRRRQLLLP